MFSAGGDLSYNSGTGQFSFDVESIYTKANFDSDLGDANTGQLPEGSNLYYTNARARAAVSGNKGLTYNSSTGVMDVDSANIKGMLSGGTGITYNSGTGAITTTDADIVHDNLSGFVADEHVAHSGVSITAGTGLKGGGTIASTRDLAIDSAELLSLYNSSIVHDNLSGFVADEHVAHSGVSITAGTGLKGGGTIASTRDLAIDSAELLSLYEPSLRHDNLSGFVADEHVAHGSVSITAGAGLGGGGTIASTRNLAIDSAELYSLYKHDNFSDFVADEHVAHGSVSIIAGKGLSGGGTIASNRTIDVDSANLVTLARTALSGTNGISYTSGTGVIRAPQPLDSNATPTFKQLRGPAELVIDPAAIGDATGTVKILGNLQVEGTQTTINSTAISLNDKTIVIADSSADSSALNGAGIVWGGDSVVDNPTFTYAHSGAKFVANREISATTLTGAVAASQLTGTIDSARIPALSTSDITSGTIDSARIPTLLIADIGNINAINHDTLTGFVADEHVAHAGVSITAGTGLKGGGTIASTRDLAIDSAEFLSLYNPSIVHDNLSGFVANEHINHTSVSIATGDGLSGGGDISSTRTLKIDSSDLAGLYSKVIVHDNTSGFVANEHIDHSAVSVIAGKGLSGGGTIASSRTLDVDSANIISFTRAAISVTGEGSYNSGTGVITLPTLGTHYIDSAEALKLIDANSIDSSEINIGGLTLADNAEIKLGTNDDASLKHTGTNLQIFETTGGIQITNYANDKDVDIRSDDGSGGTALYFKADGSTGVAELYHYGNKKIETTAYGTTVTGTMNADSATISGNITATTFSGSGASLTALPAGQLTGTIDSARIPSLATSDITSGTIDSDRIPALATGDITSGTLDSARFPIALPAVSGANLTNLPETGDGGIAMAIALG